MLCRQGQVIIRSLWKQDAEEWKRTKGSHYENKLMTCYFLAQRLLCGLGLWAHKELANRSEFVEGFFKQQLLTQVRLLLKMGFFLHIDL